MRERPRPRPRVVPFAAEHRDEAARLLAERQVRWRSAEPALPERFTDPAAMLPLLDEALALPGALAVAALDARDRLAGFMVGAPRLEEIWGRSTWVGLVGTALAADAEPELTRDLYAAWSDPFVRRGIYAQYALVPDAFDAAMDAWVRMGFGKMQAHALRSSDPAGLPAGAGGVRIARATPDDLDRILPLTRLIADALLEAPVYAISLPERWSRFRPEWDDELRKPEGDLWLASDAGTGEALALAGFYPAEPAPAVPEDAVELGIGMTAPAARGRGVMAALVGHGLSVAAERGARWCITDWRSATLSSSRAWPARGFRPYYWRMHRMIDNRIGWAREAAPPA
jgi:GNAT superfamily N-acetyltransferase